MSRWPAMMKKTTLAAYLEVSAASLDREIAQGRLPMPIIFGGSPHWRTVEVNRMLGLDGSESGSEARDAFERNLDKLRGRAA